MRIEATKRAREFITSHGGDVYVWVDDDGIGHAAPQPPANVSQFIDEQADGFVLHRAADIEPPDWWKIEFHHLPHEHVTATWDGGYAVIPHLWGPAP